jgi:hypothetical protein
VSKVGVIYCDFYEASVGLWVRLSFDSRQAKEISCLQCESCVWCSLEEACSVVYRPGREAVYSYLVLGWNRTSSVSLSRGAAVPVHGPLYPLMQQYRRVLFLSVYNPSW